MSQVVNVRLGEPSGDKRVALPGRLVTAVLLLSVLPAFLNLLGFDFTTIDAPIPAEANEVLLIHRLEVLEEVSRAEFIHTLLEWSAFCVAIFTAVFAYTNYSVTRDVATPVIGTALFFSGMIDGFRTLAAARLIPTVVDLDHFIPFTWMISRTINAIFLIAGMLPFVWSSRFGRVRRVETGPRFIVLSAILFGLMAYSIIHICAVLPTLPETVFPKSRFAFRPWDLLPLFMYLFAGAVIFPKFHRREPSLFSHAIMVSVIPSAAAQLHAAFGSTALYDNHFNISLYLKIIANLVPMAGLILDYSRAYQNEVTLRLTEEKLRVARDVQQGLLPKRAPVVPGFDLAGLSAPAEAVGGDYYDFLPMS
ncbi:MAG: PP2C family protein-serine/threonine phosphatase, partial [Planctomycetaceae bacterium]